MFKFNIRDLVWLTIVIALIAAVVRNTNVYRDKDRQRNAELELLQRKNEILELDKDQLVLRSNKRQNDLNRLVSKLRSLLSESELQQLGLSKPPEPSSKPSTPSPFDEEKDPFGKR